MIRTHICLLPKTQLGKYRWSRGWSLLRAGSQEGGSPCETREEPDRREGRRQPGMGLRERRTGGSGDLVTAHLTVPFVSRLAELREGKGLGLVKPGWSKGSGTERPRMVLRRLRRQMLSVGCFWGDSSA